MLNLEDNQIVRLFQLVEEIHDVKMSIPQPPRGFAVTTATMREVQEEIAHQSRADLEKHYLALEELDALIRMALTGIDADPKRENGFL